MKTFKFLIVLLLISTSAFAQEQKYDHSKEIDQELWRVFVESYNSRNAERYLSIHSKDIVRITTGGIRQGDVFREGIRRSYARKNQTKRTISFKFEHRIHGKEIAYEVGYFKVTYYKNGKEEDHFGRFSVVLKKEEGRWKIAQDWDIDRINGDKITKEDYNKLKSRIISK